jgi:sRNA-binding protein
VSPCRLLTPCVQLPDVASKTPTNASLNLSDCLSLESTSERLKELATGSSLIDLCVRNSASAAPLSMEVLSYAAGAVAAKRVVSAPRVVMAMATYKGSWEFLHSAFIW